MHDASVLYSNTNDGAFCSQATMQKNGLCRGGPIECIVLLRAPLFNCEEPVFSEGTLTDRGLRTVLVTHNQRGPDKRSSLKPLHLRPQHLYKGARQTSAGSADVLNQSFDQTMDYFPLSPCTTRVFLHRRGNELVRFSLTVHRCIE